MTVYNYLYNVVQGYDSPGGDHFIIPKSAGNVTAIRNICVRSRRCMGEFSSCELELHSITSS